jgi:hypothetical protein
VSGATVPPQATVALRHRVHKGRRAVPGTDPRVDTLVGMVLALTSEVAVLRERLDAHERLGQQGKAITPSAVDEYYPDDAAQAQRAVQRQRLIDKVMRPMVAAAEDAKPGGDKHDE